jgi:glycosyltransferase involved in cell wall biosynthesis
MNVCIDVQPAVSQRAGIGRYTKHLVEHLDARIGSDVLDLVYFDFRGRGLPIRASQARSRPVRWCPGRVAQKAWATIGWPPYDTFAGRADVYHFPNFVLPPLRSGRSVVTVHDMSFLRYPEYADARNQRFLSTRIKDTAARADVIITDSRFSAAEIAEFLPIPSDRVAAIYPGIDASFDPPDRAATLDAVRSLGIDRPYLLSVGTIEPRKNIDFMITVFERMKQFDGCLVLAGMPGWKVEPIFKRIRSSARADDIRFLDYVSDDTLPALYAGAEIFLITSHYEGFGFTPLEAMACNTPVLASTGGSLPEVLGDALNCLDTIDPDPWVEEAHRIMSDSTFRDDRIAKGRRRVSEFSWADAADQTWAIYRKLGAA